MIGHDDKPDTPAALMGQLGMEDPEDHLLGPIVVEEPTTPVAREGNEVSVTFAVVGALGDHEPSLGHAVRLLKPLVASRPGQQVVRATPRRSSSIGV
jgi:hypothetical protein